jgi:hypothetical protein
LWYERLLHLVGVAGMGGQQPRLTCASVLLMIVGHTLQQLLLQQLVAHLRVMHGAACNSRTCVCLLGLRGRTLQWL